MNKKLYLKNSVYRWLTYQYINSQSTLLTYETVIIINICFTKDKSNMATVMQRLKSNLLYELQSF